MKRRSPASLRGIRQPAPKQGFSAPVHGVVLRVVTVAAAELVIESRSIPTSRRTLNISNRSIRFARLGLTIPNAREGGTRDEGSST